MKSKYLKPIKKCRTPRDIAQGDDTFDKTSRVLYNIRMKAGEKYTVDITSVGMDGEGVARVDGMVVFVPKTLVGEQAIVEIVTAKKSFAKAKVIKLLKASDKRVEPKCPLCFKCGGCETLHIDYAEQLAIKRLAVKSCMDKTCGIDCAVAPTVPSPDVFHYRNKIQLPITRKDGKAVGGYFASGTHTPVPSSVRGEGGCCVLNCEGIQDIVDIFLEYLDEFSISTYDETAHRGLVRHLVVRKVGDAFSICVVINGNSLPKFKALADKLERGGYKFSLYISINTKRTNVIMGERTFTLVGSDTLEGETLGVKYSVSPQSFMQVNDKVKDLIYSQVGVIIKDSEIPVVVDAYSGIGIMSNIFAKFCDKVYAVEIVEQAVDNAKRLAELNGNSHKITTVCGDCARELPPIIEQLDKSIVVLDPPRKGCDVAVLDSLLKALPTKIIYISCNPATLARDVHILLDKYVIESVTPYDMFVQTSHVETLAVLRKKS